MTNLYINSVADMQVSKDGVVILDFQTLIDVDLQGDRLIVTDASFNTDISKIHYDETYSLNLIANTSTSELKEYEVQTHIPLVKLEGVVGLKFNNEEVNGIKYEFRVLTNKFKFKTKIIKLDSIARKFVD